MYKTAMFSAKYYSQFETAIPEYLFAALKPYATNLPTGRTFEEVMTLWTEQGGYPVVNVKMQGSDAILTQVSKSHVIGY